MPSLEEKVLKDIADALNSDRLLLPTLPEVAMRAREAAEDPHINTQRLARVISNDMALTARIVRAANSPMYRTQNGGTISDLHNAINRMGISQTSNLITGFAMQQMFQATSDVIDRRLRAVWLHSTEVAGIAGVMCKHYTRLRPDLATLAGLTHAIGILPILTYAEEHPELLGNGMILDRTIDQLHGILGSTILKKWAFADELIGVPASYLYLERAGEIAVDYVDLVMIANLQSVAGTSHPLAHVDWKTVAAFQKLGLDPESEQSNGGMMQVELQEAMVAFA